MDQYFNEIYTDFFRPLTGRHREATAACLGHLYLRLNGPNADYYCHLARVDVLTIFQQALLDAPLLDGQADDLLDNKSNAERAHEILKRLIRFAWIEEYMDPSSRQKAYRLTSRGREFSCRFANADEEIITNTQNTRSTEAHLLAFVQGVKKKQFIVDDLMIATKLSRDIVADFNDLIDDINEERRHLVASATEKILHARRAGEACLDYLEQRLLPEFDMRFRTDSVELYRERIIKQLTLLRRLHNSSKAAIETALRKQHAYLYCPVKRPSIFLWALDTIEKRLQSAVEVKLPELREQASRFIHRANILIKHLASIAFGETENQSVFKLAASLRERSREAIDKALSQASFTAGEANFGFLQVALINPKKITLPDTRPERIIDCSVEERVMMSEQQLRDRFVSKAINKLLAIEENTLQQAFNHLETNAPIKGSDIAINDISDLICALHGPLLASVGVVTNDFSLKIADEVDTDFYTGTDYTLTRRSPQVTTS